MATTIEVANFSQVNPHLVVEVIFPDNGPPFIIDRTGYTDDPFYDQEAIKAASALYREQTPRTMQRKRARRK